MDEVSPPSGATEVTGSELVRELSAELILAGIDDGECDLRVHDAFLSTDFTVVKMS